MTQEKMDEALRRTTEAMIGMCAAFAATARERAKYMTYYPMIAGQSAEMIFRLRKEIDDMIGLTDYVAEFGVPMTNEEIDALAEAEAHKPGTNGTPATAGEPATTAAKP